MEKLKNPQEEHAFIKSASSAELMEYIKMYPFSLKTEKKFVEKVDRNIIQHYIQEHGLEPISIRALLKRHKRDKHDSLLEVLFVKCQKDSAKVKLMLDYGWYFVLKVMVKTYSIPELPEQVALLNHDTEKLMEFIKEGHLSPFAKSYIIMNYDAKMINRVIELGPLQTRELDLLLLYGPQESLFLLEQQEKNHNKKNLIRQFNLVRFSTPKKVKKFFKKQRFISKVEEVFYKKSPFDLVLEYVTLHQLPDGDLVMLKHPEHKHLPEWLSRKEMPLSPQNEAFLFHLGYHLALKAYIKKHSLTSQGEVRLIQKGEHRDIMLYMTHHYLSDRAQVALIKRGKYNEIDHLINNFVLCNKAVETLKELAPQSLIKAYEETRP